MKRLYLVLLAAALAIGTAWADTKYIDVSAMATNAFGIKYAALDGYSTSGGSGYKVRIGSTDFGRSDYSVNIGSNWTDLAANSNDIYFKNNGSDMFGNLAVEYRQNGSTHQIRAMLHNQTVYLFGQVNNNSSWSESNRANLTWKNGAYVIENMEVKADNTCYFRYKVGATEYQPKENAADPTGNVSTSDQGNNNRAYYLPKGTYDVYISTDGTQITAVRKNVKSGYYIYGNISGVDNWSDSDASRRIALSAKNPDNQAEYMADVVSYNQAGYFRYVWNGTEMCPDSKTGGDFHLNEGVNGPSRKFADGMTACYVLEKNVKYKVYVASTYVRVEIDRSGQTATTLFLAGQFNNQKWSDANRMNFTYSGGLFKGTFNITNGVNDKGEKGIYLRLNINGKWYGAQDKNHNMLGTNSYTDYQTDYNFTLGQEGQYSVIVDPATGQITATRLGDVRAIPSIYITGHPGHMSSDTEYFQAGYKSATANTTVYFNPEDPDELLIPWQFGDRQSSTSSTSGQMYWYVCAGGDDNRYVPTNVDKANILALPGSSFSTADGTLYHLTGKFGSYFTSPGNYIVAVRLDASGKPVRVQIRGQIEYPEKVYLFGDIDGYTDPTYGCSLFSGKEMTDTKFELGLENIFPEATGYYVARNVKFLRHTKSWNTSTHDSYYQSSGNRDSHAVFSFASRMADPADCQGVDRDHIFDRLGTRYSSAAEPTHPAYDHGYIRITPFNFEHLRWDNNEKVFYLDDNTGSVDYLNDKSKGFQAMTINSVNAACFTVNLDATGTSRSMRMDYNAGDLLPDDTYDVLLDLRNHRVALSRQHMSVGVEGTTVDFGLNRVNVYNMQGVLIRANVRERDAIAGLPAGLYIVGKKKIIVK